MQAMVVTKWPESVEGSGDKVNMYSLLQPIIQMGGLVYSSLVRDTPRRQN